VVLGLGHSWQSALGAVFISGLIFIALSVLPIREWLINAIPRSLKLGISAGIGFFPRHHRPVGQRCDRRQRGDAGRPW
jgi:AGZA family xanthine/uracil permease-like MFS transporter